MNSPEKDTFFARIERSFYETKPFLFILIAIGVLLGTSWGISTLLISLLIVCYAGVLLLWRHEYRGSLRRLIRGKNEGPQDSKETTPTSD